MGRQHGSGALWTKMRDNLMVVKDGEFHEGRLWEGKSTLYNKDGT